MEKHFLGYRRGETAEQSTQHRNEILIARYYYMSEIKRIRFDDIVLRLSKTFFLSEVYVMRLLGELFDQFDKIKAEHPTREFLKSKWPEWDWS